MHVTNSEASPERSGRRGRTPGSFGTTNRLSKAIDDASPASLAQSKSCLPRLMHKRPSKPCSSPSTLKPPQQRMAAVTFGAICDRCMLEEMPERYSTAKSYRSNIVNHLKPRWGDYLLEKIRPMAVEDWAERISLWPRSPRRI